MLRKRDCPESADIRFERQVGQAVEEREFVPFVLDTGTEVHAEFHVRPSRRFAAGGDAHNVLNFEFIASIGQVRSSTFSGTTVTN